MDKGYKRSKYQVSRTTKKWFIKSQNIGYSSPTLDCLFESNATFTDWNETCARWKAWGHESLGQLDENSESLVFEFWALKVDIYQCLTPNNLLTDSPIFWKISLIVSMVLKYLLAPFSIQSVKVTFCLFNLFVHQTTSTDPFSALISPHVLQAAHSYLAQICTFLTPINLIKSAPVCCELIELLRFYRFRALISIGCNVKLMARFHQDALPRFAWLVFIYVGINDLRKRMYLQHRRCDPLPAIGEKRFIYEMFRGPYCTCFSIDRYHILQACLYG